MTTQHASTPAPPWCRRPPAVELTGLVKTFDRGRVRALDELDLAVPAGRVFGLLGRNGAGKTTALRVALGLLAPDAGEARVLGRPLRDAPVAHRQRVAAVSQSQRLHGWMSRDEHLRYVAGLYPRWDGERARELVRRFELPGDRRVDDMSVGQQRALALLSALAARPDVLLLDEPAAGLDPLARRTLLEAVIDALADGDETTVVLATHLVADLERVADTVGVLDAGRLTTEMRVDDVARCARRVQVVADGGAPPSLDLPGTLSTRTEGAVVSCLCWLPDASLLEPLRARPGITVHVFPVGLEDVLLELLAAGRRHSDRTLEPIS